MVTAWKPCGSFEFRVLTQAMADFLTDDTGLHNGTIREGITEKKKKLLKIFMLPSKCLFKKL